MMDTAVMNGINHIYYYPSIQNSVYASSRFILYNVLLFLLAASILIDSFVYDKPYGKQNYKLTRF